MTRLWRIPGGIKAGPVIAKLFAIIKECRLALWAEELAIKARAFDRPSAQLTTFLFSIALIDIVNPQKKVNVENL